MIMLLGVEKQMCKIPVKASGSYLRCRLTRFLFYRFGIFSVYGKKTDYQGVFL